MIGTALSQIPSNLILTKVPARIWLPGCELLWGALTLGLFAVTSPRQIYGLRFMIGERALCLVEAGMPGLTLLRRRLPRRVLLRRYAVHPRELVHTQVSRYVSIDSLPALATVVWRGRQPAARLGARRSALGSRTTADDWPSLLRRELGIRTAVFACCAYAGSMFSGFMQVGIQNHMDGKLGHAGWRWLFVIDAILTFIVAIYGFAFFPGTPTNPTTWYLTAEDQARCVERLREDGRGEELNKISWDLFKRVFMSWQFAVLIPVWIGESIGAKAAVLQPQCSVLSSPNRWTDAL